MGDRIAKAKGTDSLATVSKNLAREGIVISPQGVHKWIKGGEVPETSLLKFCKIYKASPAYIRYGVEERYSDEVLNIASKIAHMTKERRELLMNLFSSDLSQSLYLSEAEHVQGVISTEDHIETISGPELQAQTHERLDTTLEEYYNVEGNPVASSERRGKKKSGVRTRKNVPDKDDS